MRNFRQWWAQVNRLVEARIGMTADCMPDLVMTRDLFDDGVSPGECRDILLDTWVSEGELPAELALSTS